MEQIEYRQHSFLERREVGPRWLRLSRRGAGISTGVGPVRWYRPLRRRRRVRTVRLDTRSGL